LAHQDWVDNVTSSAYKNWVSKNYQERGEELA
jgi:dTDP-glucose 4,6-dehydratase